MAYVSAETICISNHFYVIRPQSYRIRWHITLRLRLLRRSRSFKVTEFGTSRKHYATSYWWLILSYTVSEIWRSVGQKLLFSATPLVSNSDRQRGFSGTISVIF